MFGCGYTSGTLVQDYTIYSNTTYNDNKWHMVTATREKSTGIIQIYVDGTFNNTLTTSTTGSLNGADYTYFGREYFASQNFFPGDLAIIQAYTTVLSSVDITSIYNNQKVRYPN
jgi:hypothetical protein